MRTAIKAWIWFLLLVWFLSPCLLVESAAPTSSPAADTASQPPAGSTNAPTNAPPRAPSSAQTWGNLSTLADHFRRHGSDFAARDAEEYARMAWEFRQRAKREGWPMKEDGQGVLRVFDPKTRAFGAYNRNGTTRTFFKPQSRDYFDRQPGRLVTPTAPGRR